MFYQLSGQPLAQSSWHIKLTITVRHCAKCFTCTISLNSQSPLLNMHDHYPNCTNEETEGWGSKSSAQVHTESDHVGTELSALYPLPLILTTIVIVIVITMAGRNKKPPLSLTLALAKCFGFLRCMCAPCLPGHVYLCRWAAVWWQELALLWQLWPEVLHWDLLWLEAFRYLGPLPFLHTQTEKETKGSFKWVPGAHWSNSKE
jgi:hypothetical protein